MLLKYATTRDFANVVHCSPTKVENLCWLVLKAVFVNLKMFWGSIKNIVLGMFYKIELILFWKNQIYS